MHQNNLIFGSIFESIFAPYLTSLYKFCKIFIAKDNCLLFHLPRKSNKIIYSCKVRAMVDLNIDAIEETGSILSGSVSIDEEEEWPNQKQAITGGLSKIFHTHQPNNVFISYITYNNIRTMQIDSYYTKII